MAGASAWAGLIGEGAGHIWQNKWGQRQNRMARVEAQKDRDFTERMSSSAYQRSVKDLRAAGLNPILAAGGPGASTPGGGQTKVPNAPDMRIDGAKIASAWEQMKLTKEQVKLTKENKRLAGNAADKTFWESSSASADYAMKFVEMNNFEKLYGGFAGQLMYGLRELGTSAGASAWGMKALASMFGKQAPINILKMVPK